MASAAVKCIEEKKETRKDTRRREVEAITDCTDAKIHATIAGSAANDRLAATAAAETTKNDDQVFPKCWKTT